MDNVVVTNSTARYVLQGDQSGMRALKEWTDALRSDPDKLRERSTYSWTDELPPVYVSSVTDWRIVWREEEEGDVVVLSVRPSGEA